MSKTDVYICESEYSDKVKEYFDFISDACASAINDEGIDGCLNISFSSEDEIQRLNRDFRNVDSVTDVLSFPANDLTCPISKTGITCDMEVDDGMVFLGDIIICYERACDQAEDYGHSLKRELCFLALHGTLHLLGYDHEPGGLELVRMREKEEEVLVKLGLHRTSSYYLGEDEEG